MLKFAPDLSSDYEYALVWGGQSNSRPWGAKIEGYNEAPELKLELNGVAITGVVINAGNNSGSGKRITVSTALTPKLWQGAQLRLYDPSSGGAYYTKPLGGYATIKQNDANELIVDWVVAPVDAAGVALATTVSGYICRPDEKWKSYPNVRILTPFQPEGTAQDALTTNLPYPDGSFKLGGVNLTPPASVTSFADCAKFLPFTFLEGIDAYGVSSEGDAANGIEGVRSFDHAFSTVIATSNAFSIDMPVSALAGGYIVVHWKVTAGGALKRSWARLATNAKTSSAGSNSISIDAAGWLGDGKPDLHTTVRVGATTINVPGATSITASAGTPFSGVLAGDFVEVGSSIGIVASIAGAGATINLTAAGWFGGTPTATSASVYQSTATATVQLWEAWIPHYNNSPHAYEPGLGFRYPNNDMMPYFAGASGFTSGAAGPSTATNVGGPTTPILTDSGASWLPNQWQGYKVTSGGIVGEITGNSKTKLYGSWIGGVAPGTGTYVFSTNAIGGPRIHNRARGITANSYGDRFGSLLNYASRLSAAIGKRVNVIHLGVNSSPIFQQSASNFFAFPGQVGWFDFHAHLSWSPSQVGGSAQRLKRMIDTIAPAALAAEGNTKPLRVLAIAWLQGEGDALGGNSNSAYARSLKAYATWLRDVIGDAGMNPYTGTGSKIPWVQPRITHVPYELTGTFTFYNQLAGFSTNITLVGDDEGWANNGIVEFCETDGFAAYQTNDDLTKLGDTTLINSIDPLHYDGKGEVHVGLRLAEDAGRLIDYALSLGSPCLEHPSTRALSICNMALAYIGESAITSLDDGSTQANLCKQFFGEARDTLLQSRQWAFALRRTVLSEVKKPPMSYTGRTSVLDQYDHCYVVPEEALNAFAVLPPSSETDSDYLQLSGDPEGENPQLIAGGPSPTMFTIENSPTTGGRLLLTNQADAVLRYTARVADCESWSPLFATAHSWLLASMLASAIIKGDAGEQVSQRCLVKAGGYTRMAANSDGNQRNIKLQHIPDHLSNR